eukprot:TRINITY_DN4607_c0_g1_i1.p1 TRINITY_DN4607_c0_g1~~TRINITY_DN4607_c0_g1_i1.p1  ORF type:complete len:501 (+),score=67.90 TRINITY_DN4607_c0_g1_i1:3-1505(+)
MKMMRGFIDPLSCNYNRAPWTLYVDATVVCNSIEHTLLLLLAIGGLLMYYPLQTFLYPNMQFLKKSCDIKYDTTFVVILSQFKLIISGLASFFPEDNGLIFQLITATTLMAILGFFNKFTKPNQVKTMVPFETAAFFATAWMSFSALIVCLTRITPLGIASLVCGLVFIFCSTIFTKWREIVAKRKVHPKKRILVTDAIVTRLKEKQKTKTGENDNTPLNAKMDGSATPSGAASALDSKRFNRARTLTGGKGKEGGGISYANSEVFTGKGDGDITNAHIMDSPPATKAGRNLMIDTTKEKEKESNRPGDASPGFALFSFYRNPTIQDQEDKSISFGQPRSEQDMGGSDLFAATTRQNLLTLEPIPDDEEDDTIVARHPRFGLDSNVSESVTYSQVQALKTSEGVAEKSQKLMAVSELNTRRNVGGGAGLQTLQIPTINRLGSRKILDFTNAIDMHTMDEKDGDKIPSQIQSALVQTRALKIKEHHSLITPSAAWFVANFL